MSDTDIYKKREPVPQPTQKLKDSSRRHKSFDEAVGREPVRKRRSKNSGLRRSLHLLRKPENEKIFWWSMLIGIVVVLIIVGIWQYYITEKIAQERAFENESIVPVQRLVPTHSAPE